MQGAGRAPCGHRGCPGHFGVWVLLGQALQCPGGSLRGVGERDFPCAGVLGSQGKAGHHLMLAVFSGSHGARHEAGAVHEELMVCSWGCVLGAHGLETGDVLVSPTLLPPPAPIYQSGSVNPSKMTVLSFPLLSAHPYFTPVHLTKCICALVLAACPSTELR